MVQMQHNEHPPFVFGPYFSICRWPVFPQQDPPHTIYSTVRERHGRTTQSGWEITQCDGWIAADMKSQTKKETRRRDNRVRRDSDEKEARMRAFEWKAKRAAERKSERKAAEEKKEGRLIFLSQRWSYLKKREGEKDPSACSQRARGGGGDRTAQKREVLKVKARKLPCMRAHREAFRAVMRWR